MAVTLTYVGEGNSYGSGNISISGITASVGDILILCTAGDFKVHSVIGNVHPPRFYESIVSDNSGNTIAQLHYGIVVSALSNEALWFNIETTDGETGATVLYKVTGLEKDPQNSQSTTYDTDTYYSIGSNGTTGIWKAGFDVILEPGVAIGGFSAYLKSTGSPTGTVYGRVYNATTGVLVHDFGSKDISSDISGTIAEISFTSGSFVPGRDVPYRFAIEYSGGDASNYLDYARVNDYRPNSRIKYGHSHLYRYMGSPGAWSSPALDNIPLSVLNLAFSQHKS